MPKYKVKIQRVETYVEQFEIEADTAERAEEIGEEMIQSGELAFDGDIVHGEESVFEVLEFLD